MTDEMTRLILAVMMVGGFLAIVAVVLIGLVDVTDPTIAKLVGAVFGYVTAILNPIIYRYFGSTNEGGPPP